MGHHKGVHFHYFFVTRKYKIRLYVTMAISITPIIALATWQVWLKQYGEIVEIIRCTDETDSQERFS